MELLRFLAIRIQSIYVKQIFSIFLSIEYTRD